jgi:hypothetical protein
VVQELQQYGVPFRRQAIQLLVFAVKSLLRTLFHGGLGVEDQKNGLRKVPILVRSNSRTSDQLEQQIRDTFVAILYF